MKTLIVLPINDLVSVLVGNQGSSQWNLKKNKLGVAQAAEKKLGNTEDATQRKSDPKQELAPRRSIEGSWKARGTLEHLSAPRCPRSQPSVYTRLKNSNVSHRGSSQVSMTSSASEELLVPALPPLTRNKIQIMFFNCDRAFYYVYLIH